MPRADRLPGGAPEHPPVLLRGLREADWPAVERIYAAGIATGLATFETEPPTWEEWDREHHPFARLAATRGDDVLGWAALSPVSRRRAYAGVAEVSVYVAPEHQREGIGRALLAMLIAESEGRGIWMLQATITAENLASVALHERVGFRLVGRRERIGQIAGRWHDTVLLERRSALD